MDDLSQGLAQVQRFAEAHQLPERSHRALELAFEELLLNAREHGGCTRVELQLGLGPEGPWLEFRDNGIEFNPSRWQPQAPASLAEATPGGVGLVLLQRMFGRIEVAREASWNRVRLSALRPSTAPRDVDSTPERSQADGCSRQ